MNSIGEKLRAQRRALGMSLQDVASSIGVARATVHRWETGGIKHMGQDKILALSRVLQIPPEEFIGLDPGEKYLDYDRTHPQLTEQQLRLIEAAGDLTDRETDAVITIIQALKAMRQEKNSARK